MKKSKNYFQKSAIILSAFMLLTIPNLNVYSSIGSYQKASKAIMVNKGGRNLIGRNDKVDSRDLTVLSYIDEHGVKTIGFPMIITITCGVHSLLSKAKSYAKYDFSGFDN